MKKYKFKFKYFKGKKWARTRNCLEDCCTTHEEKYDQYTKYAEKKANQE